jgi:hypothetical protein
MTNKEAAALIQAEHERVAVHLAYWEARPESPWRTSELPHYQAMAAALRLAVRVLEREIETERRLIEEWPNE